MFIAPIAPAITAQVSQVTNTQINAQVVSVSDGDTLMIRNSNGQNITVRLACIDTPEIDQEGGKEASNRLSTLLPKGTSIKVQPVYKGLFEHKFLVVLIVFGNKNINLQMVQEGQAWVYEHYISIGKCGTIAQELRQAQTTAQQQGIGLWNQNSPCPPWNYRKNQCSPRSPQPTRSPSPKKRPTRPWPTIPTSPGGQPSPSPKKRSSSQPTAISTWV
ncbi:thermonuclease family protein [Microcoleus sp. MON2_D5]|uniref:thermonuclease family protein n=1 Tax=Microcoleus sp. MON2_D5 TaxID=2818833 RepID=UPI002FD0D3F1